MTISEEKKQLRHQIRARERKLDPAYRVSSDQAIASNILDFPIYQSAWTVFCFVSTPEEINTRPILLNALETGKRLCVPRCAAGRKMDLVVIQSLEDLELGAFDLLEPRSGLPTLRADEVDFAVLPCLSCDRQGNRLGRGGGYYDRFLSLYHGAMAMVCREQLMCPSIPTEDHDVPVPWLVTEAGVFPGRAAAPENRHCLS